MRQLVGQIIGLNPSVQSQVCSHGSSGERPNWFTILSLGAALMALESRND